MITWYVQMDALGNFWLNAEMGKGASYIRTAELIPRKVWSGPGDRMQVLAEHVTRVQATIQRYQRLASIC